MSVSAGNPAIAVARKVGVLGAPEIENGSKHRARNRPFFYDFSTFPEIKKKHEIDDSFTILMFLIHQNGSQIAPTLIPVFATRCFLILHCTLPHITLFFRLFPWVSSDAGTLR